MTKERSKPLTDLGKDLDGLRPKTYGSQGCRVAGLISEIRSDHGEEIASKFASLCGDTAYSVSAIINIVRAHGYKLGKDAVSRHRKRGTKDGCNCV